MVWYMLRLSLHQLIKKNEAMYTTDFNIDSLSSLISAESADILSGLIQDMDLELIDVKVA